MKRRISAQGDFDGACFLYSIANSYSSLVGRQLTENQWKGALRSMPFRLDDFLCNEGTGSLRDNSNYFEGLCRNFLEGTKNNRLQITRRENITSRSLQALVTENQVVIVAINNKGHWVSVVDVDRSQLYLACSAALSSKAPYTEESSPNFRRAFNNQGTFEDLDVWGECALVVQVVTNV